MTFHASLHPNVIVPGAIEAFEIKYDSTGKDRDIDEVEVRIFERDNETPFEATGRDTLMVVFHGKIVANVFTSTPTTDGKPSTRVPKFDKDGPVIKLKNGDVTVTFGLPDGDKEHGVFELELGVSFIKPRRREFRSKQQAYVRSFKHFQVRKKARPVVAFVPPSGNDPFFITAKAFWERHADVVVQKPQHVLSLYEELKLLEAEAPKYGPWGQVNIVTHGRDSLLLMKAQPASPKAEMHEDIIAQELDTLTVPQAGIDGDTEVVFRACKAGNDQGLMDQVKSAFFSSAKHVRMPLFLQKYEMFAGRKEPVESFVEEIVFDIPGHTLPSSAAKVDALKLKAFNVLKIRSPGLSTSAEPATEIPTFIRDVPHDFAQTQPVEQTLLEDQLVDKQGVALSTDEVAKIGEAAWVAEGLHTMSVTWRTAASRWDFGTVSRTSVRAQGLWFEINGADVTPTPKFQILGSGQLAPGSGSQSGLWKVEGIGIEAHHFTLEILSVDAAANKAEVKVTLMTSSGTAVVGGTSLTKQGDSVKHRVPTTVRFGDKAVMNIRIANNITLTWQAKRKFFTWRRVMRKFDKNTAYARRALVTPDDGDKGHFGESK